MGFPNRAGAGDHERTCRSKARKPVFPGVTPAVANPQPTTIRLRTRSSQSFHRLSAQPMCLVNLFTRTGIRSLRHIARSDLPRVVRGRERGRWILLAWPAGVSAAYPSSMVNPSLQSAIEVTEEQKTRIRSRAGELQADPSIGLTWDELKARLAARRA